VILEVAPLSVRSVKTNAFESAFKEAQSIIESMPGYVSHELQRCVEQRNLYILLVRWQSLEDHEVGFRKSVQYQRWKELLHHFYEPFPTVLHYESVVGTASNPSLARFT
jgi:heme-degrading monooxygenase HmoA